MSTSIEATSEENISGGKFIGNSEGDWIKTLDSEESEQHYNGRHYLELLSLALHDNYIYGWGEQEGSQGPGILIKHDINGNEIWRESITDKSWIEGDWDRFRPEDISISSDGSVYVVGYTDSEFHDQSITNDRFVDGFIIKYDPTGNREWTKFLGGSSHDDIEGVVVSQDGSIYVTGDTNEGILGTGDAHQGAAHLSKYNSDGTKEWSRLINSDQYDEADEITVDKDGFIYVTGSTEGTFTLPNYVLDPEDELGDIWYQISPQENQGSSDGFIAK
jgi:hypothetical protein